MNDQTSSRSERVIVRCSPAEKAAMQAASEEVYGGKLYLSEFVRTCALDRAEQVTGVHVGIPDIVPGQLALDAEFTI